MADPIFVKGKNFQVAVEISAPASVKAGDWVELHASRSSGPWVQVPRWRAIFAGLKAIGEPPSSEPEVGMNLFWHTDPPMSATFDVGSSPIEKAPNTRAMQFKAPGTYKLWATTAYPAKGTSNVLTVEVTE